uniref:Uncharacterized protein n=1 Tax=Anguilla anguilla TaxID=7936 RepID=A0A0E9X0C3_ANGAN
MVEHLNWGWTDKACLLQTHAEEAKDSDHSSAS